MRQDMNHVLVAATEAAFDAAVDRFRANPGATSYTVLENAMMAYQQARMNGAEGETRALDALVKTLKAVRA